ncbi:hypothetical protein BC628DRAFT_1417412 [Trametes gibbosa]|nr:hypothetical protein BC628DRAFT_1417412 [Trametes gibbosa]
MPPLLPIPVPFSRRLSIHTRLPYLVRTLLILVLSSVCCTPAAAHQVNHTIDDQLGDSNSGANPTYAPAAAWTQGGTAEIDALQAFEGTWHAPSFDPDDTQPRTVSATFRGSAVYVYNILVDRGPPTVGYARLSFYLDDDLVGARSFVPSGTGDVQYDVPVYANASVPHGSHTIRIETSGPAAPNVSFDYIVYTTEYTSGRSGRGGSWRHDGGGRDESDDGGEEDDDDGESDGSIPTPINTTSSAQDSPSSTASSIATAASDTNGSFHGGDSFHGGGDGFSHHGSHESSAAGVIVGGTIGGIALLALIVGVLIYLHRRARRAGSEADDDEKQLRGATVNSGNEGTASVDQQDYHRPSLPPIAARMSTRLPPLTPSEVSVHPALSMHQGPSVDMDVTSIISSPTVHIGTPLYALTTRSPRSIFSKRAQRQADLAYQIKTLEEQMKAIQSDRDGREPESNDDPVIVPSLVSPNGSQGAMTGSSVTFAIQDRALQEEIQTLREEVASLRTRLEVEPVTARYCASEAPPRYSDED